MTRILIESNVSLKSKNTDNLIDSNLQWGPIGLEPTRSKSEGIDNKEVAISPSGRCTKYAKSFSDQPVERLAEVWESLSPEVQDAIAILIDRFAQQK